MGPSELNRILAEHTESLASDGVGGVRADLTMADLVGVV